MTVVRASAGWAHRAGEARRVDGRVARHELWRVERDAASATPASRRTDNTMRSFSCAVTSDAHRLQGVAACRVEVGDDERVRTKRDARPYQSIATFSVCVRALFVVTAPPYPDTLQ